MAEERRRQLVTGGVLIAMGLVLWAMRRFDIDLDIAVGPVLIGAAFLAAYFYFRVYGFLIPGCILLALGLGSLVDGIENFENPHQIALGAGFVAIWGMHLLYERRNDWWPLIPGGFLLVFGLADQTAVISFVKENWPLAFVVVGLLILFGAIKPRVGVIHIDTDDEGKR